MIGQTFQPGADSSYRKALNGQNSAMSPTAQQALQVLALRLPTVLSGRPVAPADLLKPNVGGVAPTPTTAPGVAPGRPAGAQGGFAGLLKIIQAALGSSTGPGAHITPGINPGEGDYRVPQGGGLEDPVGGNTSDPTAGLMGQRPAPFSPWKAMPDIQRADSFQG